MSSKRGLQSSYSSGSGGLSSSSSSSASSSSLVKKKQHRREQLQQEQQQQLKLDRRRATRRLSLGKKSRGDHEDGADHSEDAQNDDAGPALCSKTFCIVMLGVLCFALIFVGLTVLLVKLTTPSTSRSSRDPPTYYRKLETPAPVIHPPVVLWWFAPIFSGGGYCSEVRTSCLVKPNQTSISLMNQKQAISILMGLNGRIESFSRMTESEKSNPSGLPWSDR